jgi:hypothetical protein
LPDLLNALAAGANPNAYVKDVSMLGLHDDAVWPTSRKYGDNWLAILDTLLKHGANPNLPADYGTPLLHSLSQTPVLPAIEMLLAAGAVLKDGCAAALSPPIPADQFHPRSTRTVY